MNRGLSRFDPPAIVAVLLGLAVPMWPSFLYAQPSVGSQFLGITDHPRAVGMGNSGTGLADGLSLEGGNPASLAAVVRKSLRACYAQPSPGEKGGCVEYAHPFPTLGTFGVYARYDDLGSFPVTTGRSKSTDLGREDRSLAVGRYAVDLYDRFSVGIAIKAFQRKILDQVSVGGAVDVGTVFLTPIDNLQIGLSALHLGPAVKEGKHHSRLPSEIRSGFGYQLLRRDYPFLAGDFSFAVDGGWIAQGEFASRLGLEYRFTWLDGTGLPGVALRTGGDLSQSGFRLGSGTGLRLKGFDIDYAVTLQSVLPAVHWFSMSYRFGAEARYPIRELQYARRMKEESHEKEALVRSTVDETSQRFVQQALEQAGEHVKMAWEMEAEERSPERFKKVLMAYAGARAAAERKQFDEAWVLASQTSLQAIDLRESLQIVPPPKIIEVPVPQPVREVRDPRPSKRAPTERQQAKPAPENAAPEPVVLDETQERKFEAASSVYESGDFIRAAQAWEAILREAPGHAATATALGKAYRYLGLEAYRNRNYREAVDWWERGLMYAPDNPELRSFMRNAEAKLQTLESYGAGGR